MANPLEQSIRSAVRTNKKIADLFDQLGNKENPNGVVTAAYRSAQRAMATALGERNPVLGARQVFADLRTSLQAGVVSVLDESFTYGLEEATRQLGYYGIENVNSYSNNSDKTNAMGVLLAELDAQEAAIIAMLNADIDPVRITGDEDHKGMLQPGDVLAAGIFWITALLWGGFQGTVTGNSKGFEFKKQAVAVLDRRTTDCCLRVHGQIVPFDGEFTLTGHPAFADKLEWSPFHWYCRTSIVLYNKNYDAGLTERMRQSADYVISQRSQGRVFDQSPADAFAKIP